MAQDKIESTGGIDILTEYIRRLFLAKQELINSDEIEQQVRIDRLTLLTKISKESQAELTSMTRLCAYYFRRYHDTRLALINCRLDKQDLESMLETLTKRLGDKGLDISLGDDIPDVR